MRKQADNPNVMDMLYLVRCALRREPADSGRVAQMDLAEVLRCCRLQGLSSAAWYALEPLPLPESPVLRAWREDRDRQVRRSLLMEIEREALQQEMEERGIWYLPLKGCVMEHFYPERGMRAMSDNDILYDVSRREDVKAIFTAFGYQTTESSGYHHDQYRRDSLYCFEMHQTLFQNADYPLHAALYSDLRARLISDPGKRFACHFSDEDFFVYLTAHFQKHYMKSGAGLKGVLDTYVFLTAHRTLDWTAIRSQLKALQADAFAETCISLAEKLFGDEPFCTQTLTAAEATMLNYCLRSDAAGNKLLFACNRLYGGTPGEREITLPIKLRCWLSLAFPDYKYMRRACPKVCTHPLLLPAAWLARAARVFAEHARSLYCRIRAALSK